VDVTDAVGFDIARARHYCRLARAQVRVRGVCTHVTIVIVCRVLVRACVPLLRAMLGRCAERLHTHIVPLTEFTL
jgi:hypothetical protein